MAENPIEDPIEDQAGSPTEVRPRTSPVARRVIVHGRVQGVFFRDSCRAQAQEAGVRGWVRNEPDGSVAAHFEGPPPAVEQLVQWCHSGPPSARVRRLDVNDVIPVGATGFEVL